MNRPTLRDLRTPPWLTAGLVALASTTLIAAGDAPAHGTSYATVRRGDVTSTAGAAGTIQSADTRELVFGTSGVVSRVEVSPGDKVKAGTVLARLDEAPARDQLEVTEAALAAAEDAYSKAQDGICSGGAGGSGGSGGMDGSSGSDASVRSEASGGPVGSGGIDGGVARQASFDGHPRWHHFPTPTPTPTATSPRPTPTPTTPHPTNSPTGRPNPTAHPKPTGGDGKGGHTRPGGPGKSTACGPGDVEQASAKVTQAEVKVREAERTLRATRLTAPMDGTVLEVNGTTGGQVAGAAKTGFITLGDLTDLQVRAMFPLGEVQNVEIGQPATIDLAIRPGHPYTGRVTRIDPAATTSGTRALYGVMISLDDESSGLLTGMTATTEVVTAKAEDALYVPVTAVHPTKTDTATVILRRNGHTTTRTVHLGVRGDRYVAITSGLSTGDHVLLTTETGTDGFPAPTFPAL